MKGCEFIVSALLGILTAIAIVSIFGSKDKQDPAQMCACKSDTVKYVEI